MVSVSLKKKMWFGGREGEAVDIVLAVGSVGEEYICVVCCCSGGLVLIGGGA